MNNNFHIFKSSCFYLVIPEGFPDRHTEKNQAVDSLIIASGLFAQADLFISNDARFIKSLPPDMLVSFSG
jgi:hypothetical protein